MTAVAFAVQAIAVVVLLAAGSSRAGAVVFVLLFGLGFGVGTIARPALLADAYGSGGYATLSAMGGVAFTAAKTVGPVAAGVALTVTGSWTPVLLGLLVVTAVASGSVARASRLPHLHAQPSGGPSRLLGGVGR